MSHEPITFQQWAQADIRLGHITAATLPEWSNKLIQLTVNFGPELGERTIFTAMRSWKTPEDFIGKQSLFLCNLPPKKMGDAVSEGMILALDPALEDPESSAQLAHEPVLLLWDHLGEPGSRVC